MTEDKTIKIVLIVRDGKKSDMVSFVLKNKEFLISYKSKGSLLSFGRSKGLFRQSIA